MPFRITTITSRLKLIVYEKNILPVAAQHRILYGQLQ